MKNNLSEAELRKELQDMLKMDLSEAIELEADLISMRIVRAVYEYLGTKSDKAVSKVLGVSVDDLEAYKVGDKRMDLDTLADWLHKMNAKMVIDIL